VRCPVCQNTFEAAGAAPAPAAGADASGTPPGQESERPLWKDLNLELDKSDPNGKAAPAPDAEPRPKPASSRKPGLVGAIELNPTGGDEPAAPPSAPPRRPAAPPPRRSEGPPKPRGRPDDYDDDYGPRRAPYDRGLRRRDSEPHRGVLVLVLGIISLASVFLSCFYGVGILIGIPLGITAWVLGHGDLRKIKNNEMDPEGLGMTQAGWICGIIGTILHSLILLSCAGFFAFMITMAATQNTAAQKTPFGQPPPPAVGGQ
jgi:hypothetical protein